METRRGPAAWVVAVLALACAGCGSLWSPLEGREKPDVLEAAEAVDPWKLPASDQEAADGEVLRVRYSRVPARARDLWAAYLETLGPEDRPAVQKLARWSESHGIWSASYGLPEGATPPEAGARSEAVPDGLPRPFELPPLVVTADWLQAGAAHHVEDDRSQWSRWRFGWPWVYGLDPASLGEAHHVVEFSLKLPKPATEFGQLVIQCEGYQAGIQRHVDDDRVDVVLIRHARRGPEGPPRSVGGLAVRMDLTHWYGLRFRVPASPRWVEREQAPWEAAEPGSPAAHLLYQTLGEELTRRQGFN